MSVPTTLEPTRVEEPDQDERVASDHPWIVLVWNDPVNLMSYVTYVLQKLFGYSLEKATELMLDVHHKGTRRGRQRLAASRPRCTSSACTSTDCGRRCRRTARE